MRKVEDPLKLFCTLRLLSCVPWLKAWPYSWILCKICLTSLATAFPSHNLSTVLFGECDLLALYFTSIHPFACTIMCNHTNSCTLACTHSQTWCSLMGEWYSLCGWRVEWETADPTWFKVRIKLPYENDLISKLRETKMDTLEHITVTGHPSVSLTHDNHLITLSDMILQRLGNEGCHMLSAWDSMAPFSACESANHMTLMDQR